MEPSRQITIDRSPPEPVTSAELGAWMSDQTVFVSSVMAGMTAERQAVRGEVENLGGRVSMFEHLGGRDDDAETAYVAGVRSSDIYVGILGGRYGKLDRATGYSATHMEYNAAVEAGLRVSMWATTEEMDGRQRDFLEDVRTFHTTGSYSNPDDLQEGLRRRLQELASASMSPWCKVGHVLFRARRHSDDGSRITVEATIRDDDIVSDLEQLRPGDWQGRQCSRITCRGRSHAVDINTVTVEATAGRSRLVWIEATKRQEPRDSLLEVTYMERSPEDLTELALRIALFGEPNPLGDMSFMVEIANPLGDIEQMGLDEDTFTGVSEVLLADALIGSGRVERITALQIGPPRSGRPVQLEWMAPRRFTNVEPEKRRIEGRLTGFAPK